MLIGLYLLNEHSADRVCSKASKAVLNAQLNMTTVQADPASISNHAVHVGIFLCLGVLLWAHSVLDPREPGKPNYRLEFAPRGPPHTAKLQRRLKKH